jgi:hypothetical protein
MRETSSSAKTRQLPARPEGRIWRERMRYSTRWTGWPSRRAISPTVGKEWVPVDMVNPRSLGPRMRRTPDTVPRGLYLCTAFTAKNTKALARPGLGAYFAL